MFLFRNNKFHSILSSKLIYTTFPMNKRKTVKYTSFLNKITKIFHTKLITNYSDNKTNTVISKYNVEKMRSILIFISTLE